MRRLAAVALLPLCFLALCCVSVQENDRATMRLNIDRNVVVGIDGGGICAGVIVRTNLVVTAKHCKGTVLTVDLKPASILRESPDADILLLKTVTAEFEPITFNEKPQIGDPVYSVVNIAGLSHFLSRGYIAGFMKNVIYASTVGAPGISGGGYYDDAGRLIGIGSQYRVSPIGSGDMIAVVCSIAVNAERVRALIGADAPEMDIEH